MAESKIKDIRDNGVKLTNRIEVVGYVGEVNTERTGLITFPSGKQVFKFVAEIVYGEGPGQRVNLQGTIFPTRRDKKLGEVPNEAFIAAPEWFAKENSLTGGALRENITLLSFLGGFEPNDFVNKDNELKEYTLYNTNFVRAANKNETCKLKIDVEGAIIKVQEITDPETGYEDGLAFDILTATYDNRAVVLRGWRCEQSRKKAYLKGAPVGTFCLFELGYEPKVEDEVTEIDLATGEEKAVQKGKTRRIPRIIGCTPLNAILSNGTKKFPDKFVEPKMFDLLMKERQIMLEEKKNEGYKGNKEPSDSIPSAADVSRATGGSVDVKKIEGNPEDLPF